MLDQIRVIRWLRGVTRPSPRIAFLRVRQFDLPEQLQQLPVVPTGNPRNRRVGSWFRFRMERRVQVGGAVYISSIDGDMITVTVGDVTESYLAEDWEEVQYGDSEVVASSTYP